MCVLSVPLTHPVDASYHRCFLELLRARRRGMDFSVSVPPPSCSEGVCPPKQKTKTLVFFEILVPVPPPPHRDSHSKRREVSVNEHRDVVQLPQNSAADRQAVAQTQGNIGIRV